MTQNNKEDLKGAHVLSLQFDEKMSHFSYTLVREVCVSSIFLLKHLCITPYQFCEIFYKSLKTFTHGLEVNEDNFHLDL